MYDSNVAPESPRNVSSTSIEAININCKTQFSLQLQKVFFCCTSIANVWNRLSDYVVDVDSLKLFK